MTNNEDAQRETHAKHKKAVLVIGVIWIEITNSVLVEKDRSGFLEGNLMLSLVLAILPLVPFKLNVTHMYTVRTIR